MSGQLVMPTVARLARAAAEQVSIVELTSSAPLVVRGLLELAAFVAEHPELGSPFVEAVWLPCEETFGADMRVIEAAGEVLGVTPALSPGAGYSVRTTFVSAKVAGRFTAMPIPTGGERR